MKEELKCPKCGSIFTVNETDYNLLINQIKNKEFNEEIDTRMKEFYALNKIEQEKIRDKMLHEFNEKLNKKDIDIIAKNAEIDKLKSQKDSEIERINNEKVNEINLLKNQIEKNEDKIKIAIAEEHNKINEILKNKDIEIENLKNKIINFENEKKTTLQLAIADKEQQIIKLNSIIEENENKVKIAVFEEKNKFNEILHNKDSEIEKLKNKIELKNNEIQLTESTLQKNFDIERKRFKEQIDYYKDLKSKMSTKMVGETLEQHCNLEFEKYLRPLMPNAYFDKDNDIIDGTKGDFIFRDKDDDYEYVSIMFEMKNEMDSTASKHKNEDFFKKLNDDRNKKHCEFAVLVSLLESDNDLYNNGIVNVSHLYPNMYVIRPQFFVPFIMLIVQTSRKSLKYKRQLEFVQSKDIDITNFENDLLTFQEKFGRNYRLASEKFKTAIDEIDVTIKHLEKIKKELIGCENNLRLANEKAENLTINKLTRNNLTMKTKFEELKKN